MIRYETQCAASVRRTQPQFHCCLLQPLPARGGLLAGGWAALALAANWGAAMVPLLGLEEHTGSCSVSADQVVWCLAACLVVILGPDGLVWEAPPLRTRMYCG
jgi:hypothetical protein